MMPFTLNKIILFICLFHEDYITNYKTPHLLERAKLLSQAIASAMVYT